MQAVKMVIFKDADGGSAMCRAVDLHLFMHPDQFPTIEKVFYAITSFEANQIYNDFFGFGVYRKSFPDTYLFDGSEVKEYENEDSGY